MISNRSDTSRRLVRRSLGEGGSAWTKADIRRARQTPLKPLIENLGYRLEPRPNGNYAIADLAPEIVVKDHYWVRPETGDAGNAIDFFVRIKGTSFNEAMRLLTS